MSVATANFFVQSERPNAVTELPVFTDYRQLCKPHVDAVRDVLTGKRPRYKLHYNGAVLVFDHGCLMSQVVVDGVIRRLPPFALAMDGTPYLMALSANRQAVLDEFLTMPRDILLFYFTLLQDVFKGYALRCRREDMSLVPVPASLRPILTETNWRFQ